ncbi:glycosyltransferase [Patescibacteria group bacterium]|nr:glycosyltransferase [Patescibacteria group bacterium]MBU1256368.1 glycosyltransferase [Patescibacteria group bacterium]MBU1457607.1 glycosyltransferase [Patescibacteria group bacterium]
MKPTLLSVIIPAHKQARTITGDLKHIYQVLGKSNQPFEMIIIVDGAVDSTYQKAKTFAQDKPNVKTYLLKKNQGKGHAVRFGFTKAKGDLIAFIDAGREIDPAGLSMLLAHLEWYKADIIVGSKRHLASQINYPFNRRVLSWGYHRLVKLLFGIKLTDTQAGIKLFRAKVLKKVLPRLVVKHYAFDIELLAVANHLGFKRIYEAPIKLNFQSGNLTSAATLKTIYQMLWETAAVFYRLRILHYYS